MQVVPVDAPAVPADFHLKLRKRFYSRLCEVAGSQPDFKESFSLFKGITAIPKNHEDTDHLVEQEATFWYLFGTAQTGCYGLIDHSQGHCTLFIPRLDEAYSLWMTVKSQQQCLQETRVDQVLFVDQLKDHITGLNAKAVYLYSGVDSDSKIAAAEPEELYYQGLPANRETLWPVINNLRAIKTADEIEILRYVCGLTTQAHITAMKSAKPGLTQMQLHSVFHYVHSSHSGSTRLAFDSICSSGRDCATLHYIDNDKLIQPGQLLLHDMGGKWYGYTADQAICFPVDGKFTPKQKQVYNAVFEAQRAVLKVLKPGVKWDDMHLLAERVILQHLIQMGIVNEHPIEELQEKRIGAIFFPHGLGHFIGLRVHDVGGYTAGQPRSGQAGLKSLRTRREMQQGMVITVEPGLYFIDFILEKSLQDEATSKYLNRAKIDFYKEVGGVRLEDNVLLVQDGIDMLSSLPRSVEDVEAVLSKS